MYSIPTFYSKDASLSYITTLECQRDVNSIYKDYILSSAYASYIKEESDDSDDNRFSNAIKGILDSGSKSISRFRKATSTMIDAENAFEKSAKKEKMTHEDFVKFMKKNEKAKGINLEKVKYKTKAALVEGIHALNAVKKGSTDAAIAFLSKDHSKEITMAGETGGATVAGGVGYMKTAGTDFADMMEEQMFQAYRVSHGFTKADERKLALKIMRKMCSISAKASQITLSGINQVTIGTKLKLLKQAHDKNKW